MLTMRVKMPVWRLRALDQQRGSHQTIGEMVDP